MTPSGDYLIFIQIRKVERDVFEPLGKDKPNNRQEKINDHTDNYRQSYRLSLRHYPTCILSEQGGRENGYS